MMFFSKNKTQDNDKQLKKCYNFYVYTKRKEGAVKWRILQTDPAEMQAETKVRKTETEQHLQATGDLLQAVAKKALTPEHRRNNKLLLLHT